MEQTGKFVVKKIAAFILIYIVSMVLAEGVIIALHYMMGYDVFNGEMMDLEQMQIFKYYGYSVFLIITILYCTMVEKRSLKSMGFNNRIYDFLTGVAGAVLLLFISVGLIILTGSIKCNGINSRINYIQMFVFFGGFIVQAAAEEVMCRGFLMTSLIKRVSLPAAIIISASVFAFPHIFSIFSEDLWCGLAGIINLYLVSAVFSLLVIKFGSIWSAIGMHSLWNFLLYNVLGLNLSGADENLTSVFNMQVKAENLLSGGAYGIEASILTMVVLFLSSLILWFEYRKGIYDGIS